ncbi:hypothetical protein [Streptomyces sp. N2A]|uniref:hypothetical protein n=1 Tax=Streptomyces sp. N2A TaxID=3073936 RepID=UPI002870241E|nr:hypothetical protein [Streptomyces sp. N2A]
MVDGEPLPGWTHTKEDGRYFESKRPDSPGWTDKVDWPSWRTFVVALGDPHLTMAGLRPDLWSIGHSTPTTAAVIQQDGTILADSPSSPSLSALRGWLAAWENAGGPAPKTPFQLV